MLDIYTESAEADPIWGGLTAMKLDLTKSNTLTHSQERSIMLNVDTEAAEDFLAQSGVLGMKWGRHLPGRTEASHNPRVAKRSGPSADHLKTKELSRNHISTLSTTELQAVNNRLQTERTNQQLNPGRMAKGKKIGLGIIAAAGTGVTVYNLVNGKAGQAAIKQGAKLWDKLGVKAAETIMSTL